MRWLLALILVAGCTAKQATVVRNLGIGLVAEGALVTSVSYATHDSGDGISDAVIVGAPLLATGIAAWIAGEVLLGRGTASRANPVRTMHSMATRFNEARAAIRACSPRECGRTARP